MQKEISTYFLWLLFFKNNAFIGQTENKQKLVQHNFLVFILRSTKSYAFSYMEELL